MVLYWPVWKGRLFRGPSFSAAPSLCLRLYVWMPLRRDVKVCGWERASSGMNGFTFWVVFKVQGLFSPQCVLSSRTPQSRAEQHWLRGFIIKAYLLVCAWGVRTETHEGLKICYQVDENDYEWATVLIKNCLSHAAWQTFPGSTLTNATIFCVLNWIFGFVLLVGQNENFKDVTLGLRETVMGIFHYYFRQTMN